MASMGLRELADELQACVGQLEAGELEIDRLRECGNQASQLAEGARQDLLYLWTLFSSVTSKVNGISLVEDGAVKPVPDDPEQWPYQSVLEAMNDGWRIISFPNMALMMDETKTYGLGNEFILERVR